MLKKPCSPYDQIQPLAQKGSRFQPAQTLGKSWQVELRPGGDVYYQQVEQKDPCWDKPFRPQAHSQIDKVACVDAGNFDLEFVLDRHEKVSTFQAWVELLVKSGLFSKAQAQDILGAVNVVLVRSNFSKALDTLFLILLRFLEVKTEAKGLDRLSLNLYTIERESAKVKDYCRITFVRSSNSNSWVRDSIVLISGFSILGYGEGGFGL